MSVLGSTRFQRVFRLAIIIHVGFILSALVVDMVLSEAMAERIANLGPVIFFPQFLIAKLVFSGGSPQSFRGLLLLVLVTFFGSYFYAAWGYTIYRLVRKKMEAPSDAT